MATARRNIDSGQKRRPILTESLEPSGSGVWRESPDDRTSGAGGPGSEQTTRAPWEVPLGSGLPSQIRSTQWLNHTGRVKLVLLRGESEDQTQIGTLKVKGDEICRGIMVMRVLAGKSAPRYVQEMQKKGKKQSGSRS